MTEPVIVARTATPEGHEIVLTAIRWAKIVEGHPETVDHLETILQTVSQPDYREPDVAAGRERMFRRGGPERWNEGRHRPRTDHHRIRADQRSRMSDQTITIGDTTFDRVDYDRDADVLYLSVGDPQPSAQTYGTPEGHAVRYDSDGHIIGITLVNAKLLLDRGDIHVTVPQVVDVQRDQLRLALT